VPPQVFKEKKNKCRSFHTLL